MLKKVTTAFMIYALLFTSAFASTNSLRERSLNTIFEKMNYQLAVLWDQKDTEFYNQVIEELEHAIKLEQNRGLTSRELLLFIKSKIVSKTDTEDFQTVIDQFEGNISQEDAQALIGEYRKSIVATGTNWLGMGKKKMGWIALCILIFIGAGVGIYYAVEDDDDAETETETEVEVEVESDQAA